MSSWIVVLMLLIVLMFITMIWTIFFLVKKVERIYIYLCNIHYILVKLYSEEKQEDSNEAEWYNVDV